MRVPPIYTVFCVLLLAAFSYTKYQGLTAYDTSTGTGSRSSGGSGGSGFHYIGTSGGSHK